jgi:hypothetical protein
VIDMAPKTWENESFTAGHGLRRSYPAGTTGEGGHHGLKRAFGRSVPELLIED